jgi:hypothetical protein
MLIHPSLKAVVLQYCFIYRQAAPFLNWKAELVRIPVWRIFSKTRLGWRVSGSKGWVFVYWDVDPSRPGAALDTPRRFLTNRPEELVPVYSGEPSVAKLAHFWSRVQELLL